MDFQPMLSTAEITKTTSIKWRGLSETEKMPYLQKQKELLAKYHTDVASYKALLSVEDKEGLLELFRQKKSKRQKRMQKKLRKDSGMPKRNGGAFQYYMRSCYESIEVHFLHEAVEKMRELRNSWSLMFGYQRKPFEDLAARDKERYNQEMKEYVEKMKMEGTLELLPMKYQKQVQAEERKKAK